MRLKLELQESEILGFIRLMGSERTAPRARNLRRAVAGVGGPGSGSIAGFRLERTTNFILIIPDMKFNKSEIKVRVPHQIRLKVRAMQGRLSAAEQRAIDFLLKHPEKVTQGPISAFAPGCRMQPGNRRSTGPNPRLCRFSRDAG